MSKRSVLTLAFALFTKFAYDRGPLAIFSIEIRPQAGRLLLSKTCGTGGTARAPLVPRHPHAGNETHLFITEPSYKFITFGKT